jgi:hypoxanthine phosphoribosyltransferase
MPIADPSGYSEGHFLRVYEDLFAPACKTAGFKAIRADQVSQSNLIHLDILQKIVTCPIALCDLSSRNPNVLFELGLRQAYDKPVVLVQDEDTPSIFDIAPLRYIKYHKTLTYQQVREDRSLIAKAIRATYVASKEGEGINSIVRLLSLANSTNPSSTKDQGVKYVSWEEITSILNSLHMRIESTFRPDLVITMSGPGSFAASYCIALNPRYIPVLFATTFPKTQEDRRTNLDFHRAAVRGEWICVTTSKWEVYIPNIVKNLPKGTKLLIFDDRVMSGETQTKVKADLETYGLVVKRAAMLAEKSVAAEIEFVGNAIEGDYYMPWGSKYGRATRKP